MYYPCKIENNPTITTLYTAFQQYLEPNFRFHGETHDFWELVCVTAGKIQVAADHRVFTVKAGQAILHSPMQFHNITCFAKEAAAITVFTFQGENIPHLENRICKIKALKQIDDIYNSAVEVFDFSDIYIKAPKAETTAYLTFVKKLELLLLNLTDSSVKITREISASAKNYSVIIKTLNEHIYERLTVTDIARLCNMSEIGLQKTFSKYADNGIINYFNRLKMRQAEVFLKEGLTIKETALKLGFSDPNYFSTVFKRIMGFPPKSAKN